MTNNFPQNENKTINLEKLAKDLFLVVENAGFEVIQFADWKNTTESMEPSARISL